MVGILDSVEGIEGVDFLASFVLVGFLVKVVDFLGTVELDFVRGSTVVVLEFLVVLDFALKAH